MTFSLMPEAMTSPEYHPKLSRIWIITEMKAKEKSMQNEAEDATPSLADVQSHHSVVDSFSPKG